jgi:hypothetical protein
MGASIMVANHDNERCLAVAIDGTLSAVSSDHRGSGYTFARDGGGCRAK